MNKRQDIEARYEANLKRQYAAASDERECQWPFVESPGAFAARMTQALREFDGDVLAACRNVLIENPPALAARAPQAAAEVMANGLTEAETDASPSVAGLTQPTAQAEAALQWLERNLFERKWGGTLGQPSEWRVRGDHLHTTQRMRGETLMDAVAATQPSGESK